MKLGTKIIGNFGGYTDSLEWMGSIDTVDPVTKGCVGCLCYRCKVGEYGSITKIMRSDLIANGEGIGYMTEEAYYNG